MSATATLTRRGRPPVVSFNDARTKASVTVHGNIIEVPLTTAGNISPRFSQNPTEDEAYAISVVLRALSD